MVATWGSGAYATFLFANDRSGARRSAVRHPYAVKVRSAVPRAAMRIRIPPCATCRITGRAWFMMMMLALWEGFPFTIVGASTVIAYQLYAAITFALSGVFFWQVCAGRIRLSFWEWVPLSFFLWCVVVSGIYSAIFVPAPLLSWAPAIFTVAPLLTMLALRAIGATRQDAEQALYWAGLIASGLVLFDVATGFGVLDAYARGAVFGSNKIVFFKLESVFGCIIAISRIAQAQSIIKALFQLLALAIMGYNVFVLTESRLVIVAMIIALVPIWLFLLRGERKLLFALLGPIGGLPILMFAVSRYFAKFSSYGSYSAQDVSASFREFEHDYFKRAFLDTHGLGFGFMSGNDAYVNVLTIAATQRGYATGVGYYHGMALVDIGLPSATFQFGYLGLFAVLAMTAICVVTLGRSYRWSSDYATCSAMGFLMFALMLSPISTNFFTLFYTAHVGALLWFIAAMVSREGKIIRRYRVVDRLVAAQ